MRKMIINFITTHRGQVKLPQFEDKIDDYAEIPSLNVHVVAYTNKNCLSEAILMNAHNKYLWRSG